VQKYSAVFVANALIIGKNAISEYLMSFLVVQDFNSGRIKIQTPAHKRETTNVYCGFSNIRWHGISCMMGFDSAMRLKFGEMARSMPCCAVQMKVWF
jgi:hypothetical protein